MHTIVASNVNHALPLGLEYLFENGTLRPSRNGEVLVAPGPVTTLYINPWQRVLFSPERDANPFFHLVEAVWMLAGREDVATVANYAKQMKEFSDDGETLAGAYGYRWRNHFGKYDQLLWVIKRLKANPDDRRCVIAMWDPDEDIWSADRNEKDLPCNTHIYPWIDGGGKLNFTVCCRSNDIIWGAYGANAVHFSVLQEFMASAIGVPCGSLWQISNNYHAYTAVLEKHGWSKDAPLPWPDQRGYPQHQPIVLGGQSPEDFLEECELMFLKGTDVEHFEPRNDWLRQTVKYAIQSHNFYKAKDWHMALVTAAKIKDTAWSEACHTWLQRRQAARRRAEDDGVSYE